MDMSVTTYIINLKFSVYILKVLLKESTSQIFDLGPNFYFAATNRQQIGNF